jgi:hypothetical protein
MPVIQILLFVLAVLPGLVEYALNVIRPSPKLFNVHEYTPDILVYVHVAPLVPNIFNVEVVTPFTTPAPIDTVPDLVIGAAVGVGVFVGVPVGAAVGVFVAVVVGTGVLVTHTYGVVVTVLARLLITKFFVAVA